MTPVCSIEGCGRQIRSHGYCQKHCYRFKKNGHPLALRKRENGSGTITTEGYRRFTISRRIISEHVLVAERILGKKLPPKAVIHHVDGRKDNNHPSNLVICPDNTYHKLLHRRQDALEACGNVDWRKCPFCKKYDDPMNLVKAARSYYHRECRRLYQIQYRESHVSV